VLACAGMAILLYGVFARPERSFLTCSMLTIGALLIAGVLVLSGVPGTGYHDQFVVDAYSGFAKLLVLVAVAFGVMMSLDYNEHANMRRFEFPILMLFSSIGMMLMVSANSLMTLYVGLELMSLSIYVLAAFARDERRSAEAGLKYFVLGALASGLLLYGISLVYGFSGTMSFEQLAKLMVQPGAASPGLVVGIVFIVAGLAFKISAVPFHMWTPDVYEGAPTPVTAFMGTAPKVAAMVLLVRLLAGPFQPLLDQWQQLIVLVSIASMLLGSLAAIGQSNIKRLMAYSSIGNVGYVLLGLASGSEKGIQAIVFYLAIYLVMTLGVFATILMMKRRGVMVENVSDLAGLAKSQPMMAFAMLLFMFSLAGIPPLAGFWGKLYIFMAAVEAKLFIPAVLGVLASVVASYYYLRIVKVMYFDEEADSLDRTPFGVYRAVAFVAAVLVAVFSLAPQPLSLIAAAAAKGLFP